MCEADGIPHLEGKERNRIDEERMSEVEEKRDTFVNELGEEVNKLKCGVFQNLMHTLTLWIRCTRTQ